MDLPRRLRELRKALGLTQQELADRAGLERVEVVNLESGRNKATALRILRGLAKGFALSLQDMADFIDGSLTTEEARARISDPEADTPEHRRRAAAHLAREDGAGEGAIQSVLREPIEEADRERSTLWWAIRMKQRDLELALAPPPPERAGSTPKKLASKK